MTTNTWTRIVAATVMTGALITAATPAANAAGVGKVLPKDATVAQWQAAVDIRITLRIRTLQALKIAINGATNLTSGDKATLTDLDNSDISGLTALRAKTDAETTVTGIAADGKSMIVGYRVYLLVVPKVRFTIASDAETVAIAKLAAAHDRLAAIATQLGSAGKDVSAINTELADMSTKLTAASTAINGLAAALLAVAPSADADAMKAAVAPVRTGIKSGRVDLRAASLDALKAAAALKALAAA